VAQAPGRGWTYTTKTPLSLTAVVLERVGRCSSERLYLRTICLVPESIHSRSGDGLDGRRQIGSTPAGGGVGSAHASRGAQLPALHCRPDEGTAAFRIRTLLHEAERLPLTVETVLPARLSRAPRGVGWSRSHPSEALVRRLARVASQLSP
jgi:hypothetical protein